MKVRHPELVLAAATVVCLPMVPALLHSEISPFTAGERFLGALVACWVLGSLLSWVMFTYSTQAKRREVLRMVGAFQDHSTRERPVSDADASTAEQ